MQPSALRRRYIEYLDVARARARGFDITHALMNVLCRVYGANETESIRKIAKQRRRLVSTKLTALVFQAAFNFPLDF